MVKRFHTQRAHKKYLPKQSKWKMFCDWRKKRKKNQSIYVNQDIRKMYKKNPFKKEKKKRNIPLKIKLIIFVLLLVSWVIMLFYLPFFKITSIDIKGTQNIKKYEIEKYITNNYLKKGIALPKGNYFFVNKDSIRNDLLKDFPVLQVNVKKEFPSKILVEIKEKTTNLIYTDSKAYFLMDNSGELIKKLADTSKSEFYVINLPTTTSGTVKIVPTTTIFIPNYKNVSKTHGTYPILYDKRKKESSVGNKNVLQLVYIEKIVKFNETYPKWGRGDIKYYIIDKIGSGITAITSNNWDVKFNPEDNIQSQLEKLKEILKKNKVQLYIDLRFGERVFWK